jgi:hypothetical protein
MNCWDVMCFEIFIVLIARFSVFDKTQVNGIAICSNCFIIALKSNYCHFMPHKTSYCHIVRINRVILSLCDSMSSYPQFTPP